MFVYWPNIAAIRSVHMKDPPTESSGRPTADTQLQCTACNLRGEKLDPNGYGQPNLDQKLCVNLNEIPEREII